MRPLKEDDLWGSRLIGILKNGFEKIKETREFSRNPEIRIADCFMSCFAMFSLKWPSLLQYQENIRKGFVRQNLNKLYGIKTPPSDTYMRERLDEINPDDLRPIYKKFFGILQKNKILEKYQYLDGHHLISLDGTGHFSSEKVRCKNCCEKHHKNGKTTYYHQLLGAVVVHPDQKAVIPLCPETIKKEDGETKNDCERNAAKRLLEKMRREHPHLKMIIVEDGLASNGPHIKELEKHRMKYILGAKEGDHPFLFDWVKHGETTNYKYRDIQGNIHRYKFINEVPLNDTNFEHKVNFLEYEEETPKGKKTRFSWVTNIWLTKNNISQIMRGGRARWRIENETFNTLKNQGYAFEHNFGHGNKNLCTVMAMLMLLAFLVDQVQLLACRQYKLAKKSCSTFKSLWEHMRVLCQCAELDGWKGLYGWIIRSAKVDTS